MKTLGSKEGLLAMARISPLLGSIATIAPIFPSSNFSERAWRSLSIVRDIFSPGVDSFLE